jgi:hypothetical protein
MPSSFRSKTTRPKRPRELVVELEVDEEPDARDELVEALFELLDRARKLGQRVV